MTTPTSTSLTLAAIAALCGCGSEPQKLPTPLSWQAIAATLATQPSIEFDEEAALEFQRQAIDRCWSLEPLLECVRPVPPWDPSTLYARVVPPAIEAAWKQGTL